jgi:molybdopterin/thiamine biosynthesis adenylyltransferase
MKSLLHQILLGCSYRYVNAKDIGENTPLKKFDNSSGFYVKDYSTVSGTFEIALSFRDDPHIELPFAYVLAYPECCKGRLVPHINFGWFLCYLEQLEADWDSNDLNSTYQAIDLQIQDTLNRAITSINTNCPDDEEMEGEFSSYWQSEKTVYLLSDPTESNSMQCRVSIKNNDSAAGKNDTYEEWIAYNDKDVDEGAKWLSLRNLKLRDQKSFLTHCFKIKPSTLASVNWPPKDLKEVFMWLSKVDLKSKNHILEHFIRNPDTKRHLLLFDVFKQDMIGLFVELNLKATSLTTFVRKPNYRKGGKRKVKFGNFESSLTSKKAINTFIRIGVCRADRKSILSRNLRRPENGDLSSKKIALIGCGTIGGHLAGLLLRAGAGCGFGHFHLFDHDEYGPQNFGRHPLSTADFGKNKALALAQTLNDSTHLARNLEGKYSRFSITEEALYKYDIVIDATGRPPISKRLAAIVRKLPNKQKPCLIHGFNDGNGRASKVIVDDGTCCYGCIHSIPTFYKDGIDKRFKDIDQKAERHISCGSTYTPYDAAVSVVTAGLMQEATLNILEKNNPWTYSEHMFDSSRSRKSYRMPNQINCEICHGNC